MRFKPVLSLLAILAVSTAFASDWQKLDDQSIQETLNDGKFIYEGERKISQTFHKSGKTTYVDGRATFGNWKVSGNQYCSQWPPSRHWECYDVLADISKKRIQFVSSTGRTWTAILQP